MLILAVVVMGTSDCMAAPYAAVLPTVSTMTLMTAATNTTTATADPTIIANVAIAVAVLQLPPLADILISLLVLGQRQSRPERVVVVVVVVGAAAALVVLMVFVVQRQTSIEAELAFKVVRLLLQVGQHAGHLAQLLEPNRL